jgi:hypothetical protein
MIFLSCELKINLISLCHLPYNGEATGDSFNNGHTERLCKAGVQKDVAWKKLI